MDIDTWIIELSSAYPEIGLVFTPETEKLLKSQISQQVSQDQLKCLEEGKEAAISLLFWKAEEGEAFGDVENIKKRFGKSPAENYKVGPGPFLNLANAYWTFKLEMRELIYDKPDILLTKILQTVEEEIASLDSHSITLS